MADTTSEMKRLGESIKRIWNKISGGTGSTPVTSNDLAAERGLIRKLQSMEERYREATKLPEPDYDSIPESLGLKKKTFVPKTDEELRETAEAALGGAYDAKIDATNLKAREKTETLESNLRDKTAKYEESLESLGEKYAAAEESLKNKSIDRGLADSSIRTAGESELQREFGNAMSVLKSEHEAAADRIRQEIELAETGRQNALNEYRLAYAADVEKKISSLKNELQKELQSVNTYNAEIAKKEAAYRLERQQTEDEMRAEYEKRQLAQDRQNAIFEAKYSYSGKKAAEMQERYNEAEAFYESLPNDLARELMTKSENTLKPLLGQYYSRLKNKIFG